MESFHRGLLEFYIDLQTIRTLPRVNVKDNLDHAKAWLFLHETKIENRDPQCFSDGTCLFPGMDLSHLFHETTAENQEIIWKHLAVLVALGNAYVEDKEDEELDLSPEGIEKMYKEFSAVTGNRLQIPWMKDAIKEAVVTITKDKKIERGTDLLKLLRDKDALDAAMQGLTKVVHQQSPEQIQRDMASLAFLKDAKSVEEAVLALTSQSAENPH
tara:strand:- start:219 stop:860 length:642 start_codon:yes stop_codon:yes gene_type:complete